MVGELYVILGPTGAGKSTQALRLKEEMGWAHISSGELLREAGLIGRKELGGRLAPEETVERLVDQAVANVPTETAVLLDGFPRELGEAEWLEEALERWNRRLVRVIVLDVEERTILDRLARRDRSDDSQEAIMAKLAEYREKTQEAIDYFHVAGVVTRVRGDGDADSVFSCLRSELPS